MPRQRHLVLAGVGLAVVAGGLVAFDMQAPAADSAAEFAFRDAVNEPPPGWTGPVFRLSRTYPQQQPGSCPADVCTWLTIDVDFSTDLQGAPPQWGSGNWNAYIAAILDYVKQGQDPQLANDAGFRVDVDGATRWFHVPWMAYDPTTGREFVHGTTNERTAHLGDLVGDGVGVGTHTLGVSLPAGSACEQRFQHGFETWAVGVYNEWGGWSIGQAFGPDGRPRIGSFEGAAMPNGLPFPEGTVVAKFLTTNAPPDCVPFLRGSPEWQLNRHVMDSTGAYSCQREVQVSRLVQVDVAVVDQRSPTRWVYGTFAYNGNIDADNVWDRLAPVGLQWGSDPWTFPAVPASESIPARQSVLNHDIGIYEHFGCNGRLAGPVDNAMSSCMSCHASSFAAPGGVVSRMGSNTPPSFGFTGLCTQYSSENAEYFRNVSAPQAWSAQYPDAMNLDTSLQLAVAFTEYGYYNTAGAPPACSR